MRGATLVLTLLISSALSGCLLGDGDDNTGDSGASMDAGTNNNTTSDLAAVSVDVRLSGAYPATIAYAPAAITADNNTTVTINFTNSDTNVLVSHDWALEGFEANATTATVGNGETTNVTFPAPAPGTYTFYCTVPGHRGNGMEGTFTVV